VKCGVESCLTGGQDSVHTTKRVGIEVAGCYALCATTANGLWWLVRGCSVEQRCSALWIWTVLSGLCDPAWVWGTMCPALQDCVMRLGTV
jgi:hypothetical protein